MAKITKEELIAKINEKLADNSELAVELMEDITDSWIDASESINEFEMKYNELLEKYKARFVSGEIANDLLEEEKKEEIVEEPLEEVIDVEEIFTDEIPEKEKEEVE